MAFMGIVGDHDQNLHTLFFNRFVVDAHLRVDSRKGGFAKEGGTLRVLCCCSLVLTKAAAEASDRKSHIDF